jgi:hypothetical protein
MQHQQTESFKMGNFQLHVILVSEKCARPRNSANIPGK